MVAVSEYRGTCVCDLSIEEEDPNKMDAAALVKEEGEGVISPQILFVNSG